MFRRKTLSKRRPDTPPPPPVVQRVRIRYAKRGRLRFTSHRDFARAFERALRRASVPMAYSAGFSPHPKISYVGAAPTGVASEAEYLELGLAERVDCAWLRDVLDTALPPGLDIEECVESSGGSLPERIDASAWQVMLPGADAESLQNVVAQFLAQQVVEVERLTKDGRRKFDARAAVMSAEVRDGAADAAPDSSGSASPVVADQPCAILDLVALQATPAVRPDDVLAALRAVAGFTPPVPPRATRVAQGRLDDSGRLADPLAPDRVAQRVAPSVGTTPAG